MADEQAPTEAESPVVLTWAQFEAEFDLDSLKPQLHGKFIQRGDFIHCGLEGHNHAVCIPAGKVLTRHRGEYTLENIVIRT